MREGKALTASGSSRVVFILRNIKAMRPPQQRYRVWPHWLKQLRTKYCVQWLRSVPGIFKPRRPTRIWWCGGKSERASWIWRVKVKNVRHVLLRIFFRLFSLSLAPLITTAPGLCGWGLQRAFTLHGQETARELSMSIANIHKLCRCAIFAMDFFLSFALQIKQHPRKSTLIPY